MKRFLSILLAAALVLTSVPVSSFGAEIVTENTRTVIKPEPQLRGRKVCVPGDISTAAYYIAAGLVTPDSEILLKGVGINPTRDGMLRVLADMGADITCLNVSWEDEPCADLLVKTSHLHGVEIGGAIIPSLIDELPVLAVLAAFAEGVTVIRDAAELKVKESDRIATVAAGLTAMGAKVEPTDDGMIIQGGSSLHGGIVRTAMDHRMVMSFAVAGAVCDGSLELTDAGCAGISCPTFFEDLYSLSEG